jgi:hypothetical protein
MLLIKSRNWFISLRRFSLKKDLHGGDGMSSFDIHISPLVKLNLRRDKGIENF